MSNQKNANSLKWRFDVNAFRLLGRELITDRITALVELVKNAYDANATKVYIEFYNVGSRNSNGKIIIRDNGIGMSHDDVENKWMVVGTKSKRIAEFSPKPFKRKYIGEKGIGRFAVDKLGGCLNMVTKTAENYGQLEIKIDWEDYEELAKDKGQLTLFTEVENNYIITEVLSKDHGTSLEISKIHDIWTKKDIERAERELTKIISPFHRLNKPFQIFIFSNEYPEIYNKKSILAEKEIYDAEEYHISFGEKQEQLFFDKNTGKLIKELIEEPIFGFVEIRLFYFTTAQKYKFNKTYGKEKRIDGFKVYRDNVLATPFAEYENNPYKQRDVFGINKHLWQDTFDKIGNREFIGIIDISKKRNPLIKDATNRQDFISNEAYLKFKDFLLHQLAQISKYKIANREKEKEKATKILDNRNNDLKIAMKEFKSIAKKVKENNPLLANEIETIEQKVREASDAVGTIVKVNKEEEKDVQRKENLYLSLMSLQDYAANLSHAVRTSLGKIKRLAEFFNKRFPNPKYEAQFILYAKRIFEEITTLEKVVNFMLSYAKSGLEIEDFNVKEVIDNLFTRFYTHIFDLEEIKGQIEILDDFTLTGNRKFLEDIFENLVSNAIKALEGKEDKIIKVSGGIEGENFICYFSDNGIGIPKGDEDKIFEIYYTTTANREGAGLGLFIVQKRMEALHGSIEVVESEFESGVTFKMILPFRKTVKK